MAKLYPPNINGTIPAFCNDNGTVLITVPFSMNKAVSKSEVGGFALKIKTVSGVVKGAIKTTNSSTSSYNMEDDYSATFDVGFLDFSVGQYYKFQLAYIGKDGIVGYYSTVGVAKYTTAPAIQISGLKFGRINSHNYFYTGVYSQKGGDTTEKLYSSRFRLYDYEKNVIQDTGEIIHNTSLDDLNYEAHDTFSVPQDLELDKTYFLKYSIKSVNGLTANTPFYRIMQRRSVSPEIKTDLVATLMPDEGYIKVTLDDKYDAVISGAFVVSRSSSLNGYAWEEFKRFDLQAVPPEKWSLLDCTIEQGATYRYSLQQYNSNGIYSDRIISNNVPVDFEDMFLYDGERQLNIRFNPKVSVYKKDLLESKMDTIGSKYPFISRNGNVDYKEFSISGLISYQMDNVELFMTKEELGDLKPEDMNANLTKENITAERLFKNKVLDWLNNGKPKIFRSPAEGNYIVRLMNVSLSPQDGLSRMLHTFSCNAYEIAEFNITNLRHYGLVDANEDTTMQTRWKTIVLRDAGDETKPKPQLLSYPAYSISFTEMTPGSKVYIDGQSFVIGATGSYYAEFPDRPIRNVRFDWTQDMNGLFTYSYKTRSITIFGTIKDVQIVDVPVRQFIGERYKQQKLVDKYGELYTTKDIFELIEDIKTEVLNTYSLKLQRRDLRDIYVDVEYTEPQEGQEENKFVPDASLKYYNDMYCTGIPIDLATLDPWAIYYIRYRRGRVAKKFPNEGYYVEANNDTFAPYTGYAIDGDLKDFFVIGYDTFTATIDDEEVNVFDEIMPIDIQDSSFIKSLTINKGVIAYISYSKQDITYTFEETGSKDLIDAKLKYKDAESKLLEEYKNHNNTRDSIVQAKEKRDLAYQKFLILLNKTITEYKEANGIIS